MEGGEYAIPQLSTQIDLHVAEIAADAEKSNEQKHEAVVRLIRLAYNDAANSAAIAQAGGIYPLVAMAIQNKLL